MICQLRYKLYLLLCFIASAVTSCHPKLFETKTSRIQLRNECRDPFVIDRSSNYYTNNAYNLATIVRDINQMNPASRGLNLTKKELKFDYAYYFKYPAANFVILSNPQLTVVGFYGTNLLDKDDVSTDLATDLVPVTVVPGKTSNALVHAGFYGSVIAHIESIMAKIYEIHHGTKKDIVVTGHSLGGALGLLFAYELDRLSDLPLKNVIKSHAKKRDKEKTFRKLVGQIHSAYLFGTPLVGDQNFRKEFNILPFRNRTFLIETPNDIVAGSTSSADYTLVGNPVLLSSTDREIGKRSEKSILSKSSTFQIAQHKIDAYVSYTFADFTRVCSGN